MDTFNTTRTLTDDHSLTDTLAFFKTKILQGINTIILGEVQKVTGNRLIVKSLINGIDSKNNPIFPPQIYDVPYGTIRGGRAGIITEYKKGDTVVIGFCQRQIDSTKRTGNQSTPALLRFHSLEDAIVLSHWSNDDPEIFIKIIDDGITIQSQNMPISVETTGNLSAQCATANINATTSATITTPNLTLNGNLEVNGTITCTNATIGGKDFISHIHSGGTGSGGNTGAPI